MSRYELPTLDGGMAAIGYDGPCQTYFWFKYPAINTDGHTECGCPHAEGPIMVDGEENFDRECCEHCTERSPTVMEGAMPMSMNKSMLLQRCTDELKPQAVEWLKDQGHWHKLCMDLPF